jgi:hypothetical protein
MGVLNQAGAELGQAFAPAATANGAAGASLGLGTLATGVNVAAQVTAGIGGLQQANYQSKVASGNASAALLAGQEAESASKMKYGGLEAKQIVAQAANGVQVREGSAAATVASTEAISSMDAALIHYNAARQAYGETMQAGIDKKAGQGELSFRRTVTLRQVAGLQAVRRNHCSEGSLDAPSSRSRRTVSYAVWRSGKRLHSR